MFIIHSLLGVVIFCHVSGQLLSRFMSTSTTCIHLPLTPPHFSFMLQVTLNNPSLANIVQHFLYTKHKI